MSDDIVWTDELKDPSVREELDRRYPERVELRPRDLAGLQRAFDAVEEMWAPTIARARRLPPPLLDRRVDGEYSFVETFRHLLFAWDAWLRGTALQVPDGFHPWAVAPSLPPDAPSPTMWSMDAGWTPAGDSAPDLDAVLGVRAERVAEVRDYLSRATQDDLKAPATPPPWYPQEASVLFCFLVVLNDEWWHHRYALRDLDRLDLTR